MSEVIVCLPSLKLNHTILQLILSATEMKINHWTKYIDN